jgi:hypothetical protein
MSMESNLFAVPFSQFGTFAEGLVGPRGRFRLPIDATLVGVSFFSEGIGTCSLAVDLDDGDMGILDKSIAGNGMADAMFGRQDFGRPDSALPWHQQNQYPRITKDHAVSFQTNVESGTLNSITVVFYFLAG